MLQPTLNLKIYLDKSTNEIRVTDLTNWTSLGITPGDVFISLQIYTPAGVFYVNPTYNAPMNAPDITGISSTFTQAGLPLIDGELLMGEYKVKARLVVYNVSPIIMANQNFEYEFKTEIQYEKPCIKIEYAIDCFCAKFKSSDVTNYSGTTQVTYLHKIYYPQNLLLTPVSATTLVWSENRLANGTYLTEITTKRNFLFGQNYVVVDTLTGRKDLQVDCGGLCVIKCGFANLWKQYKAACGKDKYEADRLMKLVQKAIALITLMNLTKNCGESEVGNAYLAEIKTLLGDCDCGGGCGDDDDIWVTGACGSISGDDFDPSDIYTYIDNINIALTTLIEGVDADLDALTDIVNGLIGLSWFTGLTVPACLNILVGDTETQKRNKVLAKICQLNDAVFAAPVARNDVSATSVNVAIDNLVTLNDFATSNVVVTITTAPSNGVATVLGDGKTIHYVPGTGFVGTDVVGYTITDTNGGTSTATWTITVNAIPAVSCSTVTANYSASLYPMGAYLEFAIQNLSSIGTNVLTVKNYIIEIRDNTNAILHSYAITGSLISDPEVFTTPDAFAPNWDNVRIQQIITTNSSTGTLCGTVTYETPTPFDLVDISLSWFYGTTIPACIGVTGGDSEITKKNKLMSKVCSISADLVTAQADIIAVAADVAAITFDDYTDISGSCTVFAGITLTTFIAREYKDGTIMVSLFGTYIADIPTGTNIISGLPLSPFVVSVIPIYIINGASSRYQNILQNALGEIKVDGTNLIAIAAGGTLSFSTMYKKQ